MISKQNDIDLLLDDEYERFKKTQSSFNQNYLGSDHKKIDKENRPFNRSP